MMSRFFLGLKPTQVVLAGMICSLLLLVSTASGQQSPTFEIQFGEQVFSDSFSGDLFIAFSQEGEPRASMHRWFGAPPLAKFRVSDVEPGKKLTINLSDAVARHPADWTGVVGKQWQIQAVARVNPIAREAGLGEDDIYGEPVQALLNAGEAIKLELDTVVETKPFKESERIRLFETESPSLSKFFGFSYPVKAGVMLPENHDPTRKYPVVYDITGFGGTHSSIRRKLSRLPKDSYLHQCIVVVPDANNRYGHSVFCNSRSIGPWGDALVRDMIPQLEAKFGGAGAKHRYVTGVSSGGWSCLYLQITYPKEFAGCWSHVPDPIDFHDFQQIN
ncbi:MAG: alpha/beta hydrolase-fold protein, partial [Planctomycetota bacterium]